MALDYQQVLIMTPRNTRQLLNDFSHQSIFNFQQSRMLVRQTQHPHFLPLTLGRADYLTFSRGKPRFNRLGRLTLAAGLLAK